MKGGCALLLLRCLWFRRLCHYRPRCPVALTLLRAHALTTLMRGFLCCDTASRITSILVVTLRTHTRQFTRGYCTATTSAPRYHSTLRAHHLPPRYPRFAFAFILFAARRRNNAIFVPRNKLRCGGGCTCVRAILVNATTSSMTVPRKHLRSVANTSLLTPGLLSKYRRCAENIAVLVSIFVGLEHSL